MTDREAFPLGKKSRLTSLLSIVILRERSDRRISAYIHSEKESQPAPFTTLSEMLCSAQHDSGGQASILSS